MTVAFDATRSSDANDDPLQYSWDFGDGTVGTGPEVTHTFQEMGRYTVRLTVEDGKALLVA